MMVGDILIKSNDQTSKAFTPSMIAMFSDGSQENITDYIKISRMELDYVNYVMAYYRFIMDLPLEILIKIHSDRNKVVFSYRVVMGSSDLEDSSLHEDFQSEIILKPIYDLNNPINFSDNIVSEIEDNRMNHIRYELLAVSEQVLKTNKPVVSGIYKDVTIDEAVLNLLGMFNGRKIYYKPSDNKQKIKQMILLPMNIYTNLRYIDRVFGIYRSGIKIFNHDSGLNIIPMEGIDTSVAGKLVINVKFRNSEDSDNFPDITTSSEVYSESTKVGNKIINTSITNVAVSDTSILSSEIVGTDNNFFGMRKTGSYLKNFRENSMNDRNGEVRKIKTSEDVYDNDYYIQGILGESKKTDIIRINLENVDITLDDTFKKVDLNFDSQYYNYYSGVYEVISLKQEINTSDRADGSIHNQLVLRRNPNT